MSYQRSLLVCLSRDHRLLETRKQVLATRYDVIAVTSLEEMQRLEPGRDVDVVVLCHSLRDDDCVQGSTIIKRRWPAATILTISTALRGCNSIEPNATVSSADGPAALLGSVAHLLQMRPPPDQPRGVAR